MLVWRQPAVKSWGVGCLECALAGRFQCAAAAVIARELQVALALPDATASAMQQAGLIIFPLGPGLVCLLVFLRAWLACVWVPLLVLWVAGMC